MNTLLEVKNLKKIYHDKTGEILAIKNISFKINEGDFIAIVGPSGCGKSTILSILAGLIEKTDGEIISHKHDLQIGYMFQTDALFDHRTILKNTLIGLEINKGLTEEKKEKVIELLKTYGLNDFIYNYPRSLSGGMRQRVALIRTLATNPDILFLDEPFSALDYQTRLLVSDDVYSIIKKEKKTAVMVTHDLSEALSMADKIIVLSHRPATIKKIYDITYINCMSPVEKRKTKEFDEYYRLIWKELDIHV